MALEHEKSNCCPSRNPHTVAPVQRAYSVSSACLRAPDGVCHIPGGSALVGTNRPQIPNDVEAPLRKKRVNAFHMAATTVTNEDFARFMSETGYITEAEEFGWSFVFHNQVPDDYGYSEAVPGIDWWRRGRWCKLVCP